MNVTQMSIYFRPLPRMTLRELLAPIRGRHMAGAEADTRPNEMSAEEFLRIAGTGREVRIPPIGREKAAARKSRAS